MNAHDRVIASGLLAGPVTKAAQQAWPVWAREHLESCAECRVMVQVVRLLRRRERARTLPPAPKVEELLRRPRRSVPPADALAGTSTPFPDASYRRTGAALELAAAPGGVRAWDPDARHIMVFHACTDRIELLGEELSGDPGVGVNVRLPSERTGKLVAVSLVQPGDAGVWELWLSLRRWDTPFEPSTRVRAASMDLRPPTALLPVRLCADPLPEAGPAVAALLAEGAALGQAGRDKDGIAKFAAARDLGHQLGDAMGMVRGAIGLGATLLGAGYSDDALEVLSDAIAECEMDAHRAGQACAAMAWRALFAGDPAEGLRWVDHAARVRPDSGWLAQPRRHAAFLSRDWAEFLRQDAADPIDPAESATWIRACRAAVALSQLGRPGEARLRLAGVHDGATLEIRIWRIVAEACIFRAESGTWSPDLCSIVSDALTGRARGALDRWESVPLAFLAEACVQDAPLLAGALLRARFLAEPCSGAALVVAGGDALFATGPAGASQLAVDRAPLLALVTQLREGAMLRRDVRTDAATLAGVLFPGGAPHRGLVVASDGALAGVPWPLLLTLGGSDVPPVTEALGRGAAVPTLPGSWVFASVADPLGDLPLSAIEGAGANVVLRRGEATRAGLLGLGECGLLHIGAHVHRHRGVPEIVLADGPFGAASAGALCLRGGPVVALAGCGSADEARASGVERSLAEVFLRAGASAVVATRWTLSDAEAHDVFGPLLALWPFSSAEQAAAHVATTLRRAGHPARVWACLAVYRH